MKIEQMLKLGLKEKAIMKKIVARNLQMIEKSKRSDGEMTEIKTNLYDKIERLLQELDKVQKQIKELLKI